MLNQILFQQVATGMGLALFFLEMTTTVGWQNGGEMST